MASQFRRSLILSWFAEQAKMNLHVVLADLDCAEHQRDIVAMTDVYARDPMGAGGPLPEGVLAELIPALKRHPTTLIFLAYDGGEAIGIATCFVSFSTFSAKQMINIHDLAVAPERRGAGVGKAILAAVEEEGRRRGFAKLTLEVHERNERAMRAYESFGFRHSGQGTPIGGALFFSKTIAST